MNNLKKFSTPMMSRYRAVGAASLACVLAHSGSSFAQTAQLEDDLPLPEIVVEGTTIAVTKKPSKPSGTPAAPAQTASGTPSQSEGTYDGDVAQSVAGTGDDPSSDEVPTSQLLKNQGSSVTVVTSEQLRAQQVRHAADALRSLPGVYVSRSGGPQSITSVRIRGAESNHTLVLIDGVEVNATDGAFDFSNLTTEDIEKIEVLRGPQSALYSSGAIGGVINIVTKAGKGPLTFRTRGEVGSHDTYGGAVQVSAGNDNIHGVVTMSGRDTEGFNLSRLGNEDDGARFSNFSFAGGLRILPNVKLDGTFRLSKTDAERDDFDGTRADGFGELIDTQSGFVSDLKLGRLAATIDTFEGLWRHKIELSGVETELVDDGRGFFASMASFISERQTYSYTSTVQIDGLGVSGIRHFVTGRVDHQRETYDQLSVSAFATSAANGERERTGFAGEIRGEYFDSLFLTAAVRRDDNDSFEDFTTWNVAGSWKIANTPIRIHGAVGKAVKYPSLLELFGEFPGFGFVPNPNLIPEESLGWDAGVELATRDRKAVIDVTYFEQNLENEIDFTFVPQYTAFNRAGESRREGVEVAGHFHLGENLRVGLAYTYLRAREDDGSEEIRRPPHSGRVDVNYSFADGLGNLNLAAAYNGEMFDKAFNFNTFTTQALRLDDFWLLTAAASYKVAPGVEIYGRVENLLDEDYTEIIGIESAPIAAYAGVRFTYVEEQTRAWAEGRP